jgi:citrate synthase
VPASSAITYIDGDAGHPAYRGYPIEQLAEQSTLPRGGLPLLYGELPTEAQLASGSTRSRTTRSSTRTCASASWRASTTTPTRWACSSPRWRRSAPFYPELAKDIDDPGEPRQADRPADRQDAHARGDGAHRFSVGLPFVYPTTRTVDFCDNFLNMMWKIAEPRYEPTRASRRAMDVLFILHADHEQNCGTTAMRVVGSATPTRTRPSAAGSAAALYGPLHGGANEAVAACSREIGHHRQRAGLHRRR